MQFLKKNPDDLQFAPQIVPAIIARDFDELCSKAARVAGIAPLIQIDVMDGIFVPAYTWPYESHSDLADDGSLGGDIDDLDKLPGDFSLELHLMVVNPEEVLHEWLVHGEVKRVLLHLESSTHLESAIAIVREAKREVGLALRLDTPIESLAPFMEHVSHVQLMTIKEIGFGGKSFAHESIARIKKLRAMFPHCTIGVDGGITRETARLVVAAGADVLVVGSALFGASDIATQIKAFVS